MEIEVMRAGDAHRQIHRLEELLEMPIGALVVMQGNGQPAFILPGEADKGYCRWLLRWVADAASHGAESP